MVRTCIMPHNMKDLFKTYRDMHLQEVKQKEVDSLKKLSKDMQAVLKGYQKIVKMGDNELKDKKYNKDYEAVLKARDVILQLIGKVNTQKLLNKEETTVDLDERINFHGKSPAEKKNSEFDRKSEINGYKTILKTIEKINKDHEKFQYNNRADGPSNIFKGLQQVERTCYDMIREIEQGKWDGKVDLEA